MNLISCEYCGVVIDTSRIPEPEMYDEDGELIPGSFSYCYCDEKGNSKNFHSVIKCPCCKKLILYCNGDEA